MEDNIETQDHRARMGSYAQYGPPQPQHPPPLRLPGNPGEQPFAPPPPTQPPKYQPSPITYDDHRHYSEAPPPHTPVSGHPGYGPPRDPNQYPPEGPYPPSRSGSISATTRSPSETHQYNYRPPNGTPHEPPPHSAIDYRDTRPPYPPPQHYPQNGAMQHGIPGPDVPEGMHGHPGMTGLPYAPPQPAGPPTPYTYDPSGYASAYGKRRPVRAAQACDNCRARKAKCDEGRPQCSHCKENSIPCNYREVPPAKQEKANAQLMEKMQEMSSEMVQLFEKFQSSVQTQLNNQQARQDQKMDLLSHRFDHYKPILDRMAGTTEKVAKDGGLSMPIGHTTAAHKLLSWPAIKALLPNTDEDYVMKAEEDRGLIRLYGRGEGTDKDDGGAGASSPNSSEGSRSEDQIGSPQNAPSPTPSEGPWGVGYAGPKSSDRSPVCSEIGGLNLDGTMNFDRHTINKLHNSYIMNIHNMHPFLDRRVLRKMVNKFISRHSPIGGPMNKSVKRKRSSENVLGLAQEIPSKPAPEPASTARALPERSISNAIVLLVLGLGKICEFKENLPGPIPTTPSGETTKAQGGTSTPTATQTDSPPATTASSVQSPGGVMSPAGNSGPPDPSPSGGVRMALSNRSQSNQPSPSERRVPEKNVEVIPGLAYYSYATDILGNLQGGNDLPHVQACLLAGIYAGQLAHGFASHAWINQACRACQVLIRPQTFNKEKNEARRDLITFAFWTCLQLESDILAELDLPASGISRHETFDTVSLPRGVTLDVLPAIGHQDTMLMVYYSAQVALRKTLNSIHKELYAQDLNVGNFPYALQKALDQELEDWRGRLPAPLSWSDMERPPTDIQTARLRAKYYGAKYILYRPLLHQALHPQLRAGNLLAHPRPSESPTVVSGQYASQTSPPIEGYSAFARRTSEMGPPTRAGPAFEDLDPNTRRAAEICVKAAINSTVAFDGVKGRLIVTNILGTAHAQFGNMLVLAATYKSPVLSRLVSRAQLHELLDRTIGFLARYIPISPTLKKDAEILFDIKQQLFSPES